MQYLSIYSERTLLTHTSLLLKRRLFSFIIVLTAVISFSCGGANDDAIYIPDVEIDFHDIKDRGSLKALIGYNAYSYFLYKGQPMGYEYELLNLFAEHAGVKLELILTRSLEEFITGLNRGVGDIAAYSLTVTKERQQFVTFTEDLFIIRQVLVQRKPGNWREITKDEIDRALIRNPLDLSGKTVYIRGGSAYGNRLKNLSQEIGGPIKIVSVDRDTTTGELIRLVAENKIDLTVADSHIAGIYKEAYPEIDVETEISFPQRIAWAVRNNSPRLLDTVNTWLRGIRGSEIYNVLYNKYFEHRRDFKIRHQSDLFSQTGGNISPFDELLKEESKHAGWDWRLLASLMYQESEFNPKAKSWAGARGLMQLMPATGKEFGADDLYNPRQNIRAGIRYIKYLRDYWADKITKADERKKFVLASYNAGPRHIEDARLLTEKFGKNQDVWNDNVAVYILKLTEDNYYTDPAVKYGYFRGDETYWYVDEIYKRYQHYKKFIPLE